MKTIFTLLFSCIFLNAISQNTYFKKMRAGGETYSSRFTPTKDGGFIQVCSIHFEEDTFKSYHIGIIKYNSDETILRSIYYEFADSIKRYIGEFNVAQTADSGYII